MNKEFNQKEIKEELKDIRIQSADFSAIVEEVYIDEHSGKGLYGIVSETTNGV